ncbi:MAG TPA: endonuclease/exonuclease/phosphatase family protein [Phycisphaerae bacterium]|nr:endonuclease/exonuclease/phosphatase family protein [Phycisphaerae bacterium]
MKSPACRIAAAMSFAFALQICSADPPPTTAPAAGDPGIIDWRDAPKFVGREVIVQGRIVQARNIGRITFLNFDPQRSFTAIVRDRSYKNFPAAPATAYAQKFVRIRGTITEYKGKPQIEFYRPDQVTVLEKEEPIPEGRAAQPLPPPRKREFKGVLTLACYNVENLFDSHDDPYRQDEGTETKPEAAQAKAAETIRSLDADIIALEEVENRGVLEQFVANRLGDLGYANVVLFEGNDGRGIDCALLTWLPVGPVTSYRHVLFDDGSGGRMTFRRDLLRITIEPPGHASFDVFVVHLKCCGGTDDVRIRNAEAVAVRAIVDDILKGSPSARFVICGDFNDKWDSAAMKTIRGSGDAELEGFLSDLSEGSVSYHKAPYRSIIDHIIASPAMAERYLAKSYRIATGGPADQASDHYPVVTQFNLDVE